MAWDPWAAWEQAWEEELWEQASQAPMPHLQQQALEEWEEIEAAGAWAEELATEEATVEAMGQLQEHQNLAMELPPHLQQALEAWVVPTA